MAYEFKGFFAEYAEGLIDSAIMKWPQARAKVIFTPFYGVGLRLPDLLLREGLESVDGFVEELPSWSRNFPETTFVYVYVDCFGGVCDYSGYVCKAGDKLLIANGDKALSQLFALLNVRLNHEEYFEPFTRKYPW